ncbi:flagellin [Paracoccaceae bacterium]|nr:flagellin [Paracoccaceae bacterium]
MSLSVATNSGALMAQAAASSVNREMEVSMERLSTGKRINSAADDAAGIAIATRLTSEIQGTNQAIRNAMDGQALIDTAEGAHEEITTLLQRMRELAVQAANDTNDTNDRNNLQTEFEQLTKEVNRISQVTTWAGQKLLHGGVDDSSSHSDTNSFTLHIGSNTTAAQDQLSVVIGSVTAKALGVGFNTTTLASQASVASLASTASVAATTSVASQASLAATTTAASVASVASVASIAAIASIASQASVAATGTQESQASVASVASRASRASQASLAALAASDNSTSRASRAAFTSAASLASLASTASQAAIVSKAAGEIHSLTLNSASNALTVINALDAGMVTINSQRATLGSLTNRLDNTVSNLTNISTNLQAGRGRIEDADFAAETTNLAKAQILQQASTAMLAQANASKQNVLSLLQG